MVLWFSCVYVYRTSIIMQKDHEILHVLSEEEMQL